MNACCVNQDTDNEEKLEEGDEDVEDSIKVEENEEVSDAMSTEISLHAIVGSANLQTMRVIFQLKQHLILALLQSQKHFPFANPTTIKRTMSFPRARRAQGGRLHNDYRSSFSIKAHNNNINHRSNLCNPNNFSWKSRENISNVSYDGVCGAPLKRRKISASAWEDSRSHYQQPNSYVNAPSTSNSSFPAPPRPETSARSCKRDRSKMEDDVIFMSRDEIERCSPSRKDGIDPLRETYLRYSYCAFLQNLGLCLELPQTTIGTAMVLCHRFFVRRSHAGHDRFLIATAALFLAAKYEETPRPLNDVLKASCDICHKQDLTFFSYLLPVDWFEEYRERVLEAEQMILTTLDFELSVQHPYVPLTAVLKKLGLSQSDLVNLALKLVSEG
ncbi:hypothetical protein HHK36_022795 [Tetracentron sinense]|uniref:Cyclin-like domain-containing protein n=1 Tax=Tetracentron sinense TaxID=13715 RepID=A0A834YTX3_TETSI|nr:hypothetical protein HHK36_022795 [Tetracentron sinense]